MQTDLIATSVALTLLLNIPFGYWRAHAKARGDKREWLLAIHLPIPLLVALRLALGVQSWSLLPLNILAFATGQLIGGQVYKTLSPRCPQGPSRSILRDLRECRAPL